MKRICSLFIVLALSFVCCSSIVSAEGISTYDLYTSSCSSTLTISGTTATCISKATGYAGTTTKIEIFQILQKNTSGNWGGVTSWFKTDTGYKGSATNYKYGLSSGSYRLKTVFTVYSGSKSETITKYSTTKTC